MANTPVEVKGSAPARAGNQDPWRSLRSEMDRLFDRFSGGFGFTAFRSVFDAAPSGRGETPFAAPAPAIDLKEDATCYRLSAELPGMTEQDIEIVVPGDTLTLKGHKKRESEREEGTYHLTERSYGSFQRSFYVPDGVDRDKISADMAKGVLTVTLPKTPAAAAEPKKIDVKAGS